MLDYVATMQIPQSGETKSNDSPAVAPSPEKEALKVLTDYSDAVNNQQFEKAYNFLTPELKNSVTYENFVKNLGNWDLKLIEHKVISSNDNLVKIQMISESSAKFKEGTVVRKFRELMTVQKTSSGWRIAGAETTMIDQKLIK